ncbi:putative nuclease HARBI1 isoform X2 [Pectinophora gossypiella]|uniref:putative nuclease HARBI1 isoform X2 n=1 Tax=Pectinophora gossypiella TaxID=13191 RepID=UPI00214F391B|nr:putative nuclease HARBI1 isoform X2 [Pectinophora gossypiella]
MRQAQHLGLLTGASAPVSGMAACTALPRAGAAAPAAQVPLSLAELPHIAQVEGLPFHHAFHEYYVAQWMTRTVCGDLLLISQSTASNIITKVSKLLAKLIRQYVKFPQGAEAMANRELFQEMGRHGRWPGLPGIDGAIDCTHIKIVSTPKCQHHEVYRNRKSYFSINVQAVVGPRMEFLDIVARWAGSMHDSRIFQMSSVYTKYRQNLLNGRLVGDNGYPSLTFMLTPVRPAPEDAPTVRYNRAQIKTRNIVERTFGIWKRRFPCLQRGMGNKLTTVSNIIVACAVLHNLSIHLNDDIEETESTPTLEEGNADPINELQNTESGFVLRNSIIANYFT